MRPTLLALTCLALVASGSTSTRAAHPRADRDAIEWPSGEFPTLQSAIDALREGGMLRIKAGRFDLREPLVIRNKRITIEGAGCGEALPRGRSRTDRVTHLAGPRPARVVPFGDVAGLVTYLAAGEGTGSGGVGGVLRGVRLSGFDAGVRIVSDAAANGVPASLTIEDTCIFETGRGIASAAPSAKIVAENVLIRDVLWNGISISPSVLGVGQALFTSFGLTVVNTGQACVVVKNGVFTAFQDLFDACGWNGGPPGLGAGVLAENAGLNFTESEVNVPNGPGIAAAGSTTLIQQQSLVRSALGAGILLFNPLYALIKDSHVIFTGPYPAGHVQAGAFGDGILVAGQGTVWIGSARLSSNARAGIANFGSFVDLGSSKLTCHAFDLEGERYPLPTDMFVFNDRGGNKCGCPLADQECIAQSAGFEPPAPAEVIE